MAASSLLMGTFFGLLLAGYMTWVHGRRVGRIVQLIQVGSRSLGWRWWEDGRKTIGKTFAIVVWKIMDLTKICKPT
jgi:hypothetical protein